MPAVGQPRPRAGMFANPRGSGSSALAFLQGAQDAATFGLGDQAYALVRAGLDARHPGHGFWAAYRNRIKAAHEVDEQDARLYGGARTAGQFAAALLPIPGGAVGAAAKLAGRAGKLIGTAEKLGGTAAKLSARAEKFIRGSSKIGVRIKETTPLTLRERAFIGGAGGVTGAGGQAFSDATSGHFSSFGDYAGAALGGTVNGLMAIKGRPILAGAAGGAATSLAQDEFNGRAPSLEHAALSASMSGLGGAVAGVMGHATAARLDKKAKEKLGELGSRARTLARGDRTVSTEKRRLYLSDGKYTYPDQRTASNQFVESKFGVWADLSERQKQAYRELGLNYRVDHFLPRDVGAVTGLLGAQAGYHAPMFILQDQDPKPK